MGKETPPPPPLYPNINSHAEGLSAAGLEEKDYLISCVGTASAAAAARLDVEARLLRS